MLERFKLLYEKFENTNVGSDGGNGGDGDGGNGGDGDGGVMEMEVMEGNGDDGDGR